MAERRIPMGIGIPRHNVHEMRRKMAVSHIEVESRADLFAGISDETQGEMLAVTDQWDALLDVAEVAHALTSQRFGSLNQRDFYRLRECLERFDFQRRIRTGGVGTDPSPTKEKDTSV